VILGACKADHPIGTVEADAGSDASVSTSPGPDLSIATPGQTVDVQPLGPLGPVESWTGWVENYTFKSGSDAIKFSFASDPNGRLAGQVVIGSGTPPPPATDPNVGYPDEKVMGPAFPLEGYSYTMFDGNITSNRIRFTLRNYEPWAGWCALQTPPSDVKSGNSTCLQAGNGYADPANNLCLLYPSDQKFDAPVKVDCGVFFLCSSSVCFCSPTGCRGRVPEDTDAYGPTEYPTVSFDMAYSGTTAMGSSAGYGFGGQNVYFTKDP
jgi:hypothetical protein